MNPLFWFSLNMGKDERGVVNNSSILRIFPSLHSISDRLKQVDFIVYKYGGITHLSVNFSTISPIDRRFVSKISVFLKNFKSGIKKRNSKIIPYFASPNSLSIHYKVLKSGIIFDFAPFPGIAGEFFVYLFSLDRKMTSDDFLNLGTLSQILMRYDLASMFYNRACELVRKRYNFELQKVVNLQKENLNNRRNSELSMRFSKLLEEKNRKISEIMDLSLVSLYLSGRIGRVKKIMKMAGSKGKKMYKNTYRLLKENGMMEDENR